MSGAAMACSFRSASSNARRASSISADNAKRCPASSNSCRVSSRIQSSTDVPISRPTFSSAAPSAVNSWSISSRSRMRVSSRSDKELFTCWSRSPILSFCILRTSSIRRTVASCWVSSCCWRSSRAPDAAATFSIRFNWRPTSIRPVTAMEYQA